MKDRSTAVDAPQPSSLPATSPSTQQITPKQEEGEAGPGPSTRSSRARTSSGTRNAGASSTEPQHAPAGPTFIQPDHFSPLNNSSNSALAARGIPTAQDGWLSPEDDPNALRGIPVFRPTMEEFEDFEGYVTKTVPWGQLSGITKIIPPAEWTSALPPITKSSLADVRIHHPIQQNLLGNAGLFRVLIMVKNKNRDLTVQEWFRKCKEGKFAGPGPKDVARAQNRDSKEAKERLAALQEEARQKKEGKRAQKVAAAERKASKAAAETDGGHDDGEDLTATTEIAATDSANNVPPLDSSLVSPHSSPDPIATTPDADPVDPWYKQFDPSVDWLPKNTKQEDYTNEACAAMERHFWKNMGMGEPSWYGADMEGSLFVDEKTPWNVAHLPNLLNRWDLKSLPGVNSPYLYFGMWGASFAWHVEDMDLFSINYIHFGAPKFWYAVPQQQAEKLERVLQGYYPEDSRKCDQFLRHKSFAVSPYRLANDGVHVNMLVHNQNEFVITYPRGYHAGFNMGFNCAESVNFALDSWVELGRRAKACQCVDHSVKFDVDEILANEQRRLTGQQELLDAIAEERRTKKPRKRHASDVADGSRKRARHNGNDEDKVDSIMDVEEQHVILTEPKMAAVRKKKPKAVIDLSPYRAPLKPAIVQENPAYPCLFCPSLSTKNLLPVFEPSDAIHAMWKPRTADIKAHHSCALAMPGVGIEDREVDGQTKTYVVGADNIEKGRWNLKCAQCVDKRLQKSGAKVQCTKGKCPKAYHVSCAEASDMVYFKIWEVQTPIVLPEGEQSSQPDAEVQMSLEIKTELLCSQHNPDMKEKNEQKKADAFKLKVMAIPLGSAIKIKVRTGTSVEYTLLETLVDSRQIVVTNSAGDRATFPWSSIDFRPAPLKPMENEYARHHTHVRRAADGRSADDTASHAPDARSQQHHTAPDAGPVSAASQPCRSAPLRVNDLLNPQPEDIPSRVVLCDSTPGLGSSSRAYPSVLQRPLSEDGPSSHRVMKHRYALQPQYMPHLSNHPYNLTSFGHPPPYTSDPLAMSPATYIDRRGSAPTHSVAPAYTSVSQTGPSRPTQLNSYRQSNSMTAHGGPSQGHAALNETPAPLSSAVAVPPQLGAFLPTSNQHSANEGVGRIDLGLARMQKLLSVLRPLTVPAIHLAGTNGKGSVSAILESCLMAAGLRVARYNSPHLIEPRDAIRINGVPPSKNEYAHARAIAEQSNRALNLQATTFEIATAAAYSLINDTQPGIDIMIIECGLGGARDATNVIPDNLTVASALTSVGLDHTTFLGDTITEIASEKSEIAVNHGLLIIGPQTYRDAVTAASRIAAQKGARVVEAIRSEVIGEDGTAVSLDPFHPPGGTMVRNLLPLAFGSPSVLNGVQPTIETELNLGGRHQLDNLSLALTVLHTIRLDPRARSIQSKLEHLSDVAIKHGVAQTQWAGRCSWLEWKDAQQGRSFPILVDGAHNGDSAATLRQYIDGLNFQPRPPITFIISLSSSPGKSIDSVLRPLLRSGDSVEVVEFHTPVEEMPWIQPVDRGQAAAVASQLVGEHGKVIVGGSSSVGLQVALRNATRRWSDDGPRLVVVCGSLYLVADVYRLLQAAV